MSLTLNVRCARHLGVKIDAAFKIDDKAQVVLDVEPCPECHSVDEWAGFLDGQNDRPCKSKLAPGNDPNDPMGYRARGLPVCGNRITSVYDCDDTGDPARPEDHEPTMCSSLRPGFANGKPTAPVGCWWFERLIATTKGA